MCHVAKEAAPHGHPWVTMRKKIYPGKSDGRLLAKILRTAILVLNPIVKCGEGTNSPELSLLIHSHFLATTLDFILYLIFTQWPSWVLHDFLQLGMLLYYPSFTTNWDNCVAYYSLYDPLCRNNSYKCRRNSHKCRNYMCKNNSYTYRNL